MVGESSVNNTSALIRVYNDAEKAKSYIEEGLSKIDKYSFGSDRAFEKELLLKLKNEIESK